MVDRIPLVGPEEMTLERINKSTGRITTTKCRILEISVPRLKKEIEKKKMIEMSRTELTLRMRPSAIFDHPTRNYWDAHNCLMQNSIHLYKDYKSDVMRMRALTPEDKLLWRKHYGKIYTNP